MQKLSMQLLALASAGILAAPAQALTLQLGVEITSAAGGNPFGAVVGTTPAAGTADTGAAVISGVGTEFPSLNSGADATADLSLTIGNIAFTDEDEIEFSDPSVPALVLENGAFMGLDYVVLFTLSGTEAVGVPYDPSDLGQDTSGFEDGNHYWADFDDDGSLVIGRILGFEEMVDPDEGTELGPQLEFLVHGNVFVPEPSLAVLLAAGLLAAGVLRRH